MSARACFPGSRALLTFSYLDNIQAIASHLLDNIDVTAYRICLGLEFELERAHHAIDQIENALRRGTDRYDLNFYCVHYNLDANVAELINEVRNLRDFITNHLQRIFQLLYELLDVQLSLYTYEWRNTDLYRANP